VTEGKRGKSLTAYRKLLSEVDAWFASVRRRHGAMMKCGSGCSDCCHGIFDIGPHDVALVRAAYRALPAGTRTAVRASAQRIVDALGLRPPYEVAHLAEAEVDRLSDIPGPVPCPFLDPAGACRIYDDRPSTCRFMGLPLVDPVEGAVHAEWCGKNFKGTDPLGLPGMAFGYATWEADVDALPVSSSPCYTFIPCAILLEPP